MALCLLKILKDTSYFPQKSSADIFTSDEVFIGSLMMRHMNVLQFNAHEIYEFFRGDKTRMKPNKNHLIGVGVYPQASFFKDRKSRQQELSARYWFTCDCRACREDWPV